MSRKRNFCRGMTLLEMTIALVVMAIICTAVTVMLTGAAKTSLFVTNGTDEISQVEIAYRRIAHNLQAASAISAPTNTTAASTLTIVTQPDASNGNATYSVTYTLSGTNLTESDSRYNATGNVANTLVSNVSTFSVTRQSMTSPTTVLVTITCGTNPIVTRSVTIYCRNI